MSSEEMHEQKVAGGPAFVRAAITDYYKAAAGLLVATIPVVLAIEWLPRAPEGYTKPGPLLLFGALLIVVSLAGLRWLKPRSLTAKWTFRASLGFGVLFSLVAPLAGV